MLLKEPSELLKDELLSDDTIMSIFEEEKPYDRELLILKYSDRAKELKCLQSFNNLISAAKKEEKLAKESNRFSKVQASPEVQYTNFQHPAYGNVEFAIPGWVCDENGIYKLIPQSGTIRRACYHPICPIQILKNVDDGKQKIKLAFKIDEEWNEVIVDRQTLSTSAKVIQLSDFGVNVHSENAKMLVEFLSDIEHCNKNLISSKDSSSKFGWSKNGSFIPYDTDVEFDARERFPTIAESVSKVGDRDKWMELALEVRQGRREPNIYIVSALASILVKPLNVLPFFVNLWTETGRGKTVALMVAASIWGNPAEGKYLTDPTSTKVALEQRCNLLNSLPIMIDDLSKLSNGDSKDFTDLIYFLCGGKGRDRSDIHLGVQTTSTWKNVILTNMERPLATETMRGGAINRILDFECDSTGFFIKDGIDQGRRIVETVKENYGFIGEEFVRIVQNMPEYELKKKFSDYVTLIKEISKGDTKEEKQISPLAVLLIADELSEQHIFKDGVRLDVEWCVSQLKSVDVVSENERAFEALCSEVYSNISNHFLAECRQERWGFMDEDGYAYIIPTAYRKIASNNNFSGHTLAKWAFKRGLLKTDGGVEAKLTKKYYDRNSKIQINCYAFKIGKDAISIENMTKQEQEELPFL